MRSVCINAATVKCARFLAANCLLVCGAHLSAPLRGQSFSACGSNICSSTGAIVGIGTMSPNAVYLIDAERTTGSNGFAAFYLRGDSSNAGGGAADFLLFDQGAASGAKFVGLRNQNGLGSISSYTDAGTYQKHGIIAWDNVTGNVGIGTTSPQHPLHVLGTIGATEVIVSSTGADYVFKPEYHLTALSEVASYIEKNHHLPDIPSEQEVQEKGVNLGEMQTKLLAKIEELTLHMIQADGRNDRLEEQNRRLSERIALIESRGADVEVKFDKPGKRLDDPRKDQ